VDVDARNDAGKGRARARPRQDEQGATSPERTVAELPRWSGRARTGWDGRAGAVPPRRELWRRSRERGGAPQPAGWGGGAPQGDERKKRTVFLI
jgi:hypothetical protein